MGSSDNLAAIEPWMFRSTIGGGDSWYADAFSRDTETALTKALQQSFFTRQQHSDIIVSAPIPSSYMVKQQQNDYCSTTTSTITASGSGSEPETPGSKRRGPNLGVSSVGKTAKRKSRASKRSMTTFIQADPSNFRQMVQQVTGVKLEGNGGQMPVSTVVKPEALRQPFINKLHGLLPTLDTSRYLLDHHNNNINNNNTQRITVSGTGFSRPPAMADGGGGGIDFESFSSFPTLESWN
ncbi:hypothetical protein L6452_02073 [Arctium lappa]|uniref:Uncharacterized protein n=1 Tax=Arctium lappa TaxID=4217 RepID=A0ACB9FIE9_ARCLA|nr:hypothetical protein L6452_02073 [Arctium lappa]